MLIDCNVGVAVKSTTELEDLLTTTLWLEGWKLSPVLAGVTA